MKFNLKKDWKFYTVLLISIIVVVLIITYTVSIKNKLYTGGIYHD